ncbi:hypothetical protein [Amycolatopsis suaedae]|uniref:SnoaL-like domain-containing protein n=1 Tax=Amycolatopsis suaedae TaxID=2510978 RepID=A0A4Q7JEA3_9PSEU|nr:hypothetical protein [Amycolatopsis suaedae]RZQ65819.1 hypothetical protein EWH70_01685 [Amycolatopsis suaedae]
MRGLVLIAVVCVALAGGFAGWSGWRWWQAEYGGTAVAARARDDAMDAGRQAVALLNTLDHRAVDDGLRRWLEVSAGALHEELSRAQRDGRERLAGARTVTVGTVVDAAVTELDAAAGTARMIASVDIQVTPDGGQPTTKRARQQADLVRVGDTWKLGALGQVPTSPV